VLVERAILLYFLRKKERKKDRKQLKTYFFEKKNPPLFKLHRCKDRATTALVACNYSLNLFLFFSLPMLDEKKNTTHTAP